MRLSIQSIVPSDQAQPIGERIAAMAAREAAFFDRLWSVRNPRSCVPRTRRRHKQFLSEFVSYYCCVCDLYLHSHENARAEWFVDTVVNEVVARAIRDPFLEPRMFQGDMPRILHRRYRNRITERRSLLNSAGPSGPSYLTSITAKSLVSIVTDETADKEEAAALQSVISQRLEWTSRELTSSRAK